MHAKYNKEEIVLLVRSYYLNVPNIFVRKYNTYNNISLFPRKINGASCPVARARGI